MLDNKCTEINTYIEGRRSTETWKFIRSTITEKRGTMPFPIISHKKSMDHYRELLTGEISEYRIKIQPHIKI